MLKYDIAICVPAIREQNWETLYSTAFMSCAELTFQMVLVGPTKPSEFLLGRSNFHWIEDFGAPARAAQIGSMICNAELFTWGSDDGHFLPFAIEEAAKLWKSLEDPKAEIAMRYLEGQNRAGSGMPDEWFNARHHDSLRVPGVKDTYKIAPVGMLSLEYFRFLGGWDCSYEHLNMCCHDLSFRIQEDGGQVVLSPSYIMSCDWNVHAPDYKPVQEAFDLNDLPLFQKMYSAPVASNRIQIPYNNWETSPSVWSRRFKK